MNTRSTSHIEWNFRSAETQVGFGLPEETSTMDRPPHSEARGLGYGLLMSALIILTIWAAWVGWGRFEAQSRAEQESFRAAPRSIAMAREAR